MRVLLTNDDGIEAEGLQVLRRALLQVPGIELLVIAPDGNRSAIGRSITTRRPLWVEEVDFGDGTSRLRDRRDAGRLRAPGATRPRRRASRPRSSSPASTTAPTSATTSPTRARSPPRSRASCSGSPASRSPSSPRAARWTSGSAGVLLRARRRFVARVVEELARGADARGHAAERQRPRRRRRTASRSAGWASASTATSSSSSTRRRTAGGATGCTAWSPATTTSRGRTSRPSRAGHIAVTPLHFDLPTSTAWTRSPSRDLARLLAPPRTRCE